ncbi:MAG TPA: VWA domain-containing protein [Thermoanaerobaculia bacterium]|nr:VWA domain-containing protein [Thermoanaerobaculia bacterium]
MRRLALLLAIALPMSAQFRESITVVRVLVDVRVTDYSGNPISDLTATDFDVKIGGKRAEVESVQFIRRADVPSAPSPVADGTSALQGHLFVVFVQTDFARHPARVHGQMNFLRYADRMIAALAPEDRIAVFQFDSHLKFRLDFTSDKDAVRAALRETLRTNIPPPPPLVPNPALAPFLDREAMRRAADSERGLLLVGDALRNIAGPKTMLLFGWGLGRWSRGVVWMTRDYEKARRALDAARTSIFALDTMHADYHDLELGLMTAAEDTGGFYAKTHVFPQIAVERLQRTLAGHYELELRRPNDLEPGTHDLRIRVKRRGVTVLAPSSYMDRH